MKILKVFGAVVGIHVFALILIFANPGCSAMTKSTPAMTSTSPAPDTTTPTITVPTTTPADASTTFDPNSAAVSVSTSIRYSPTRPGTTAAGALEAEPVSDVTPATSYTVAKGESLSVIAHRNHLTKSELAAANNLRPESSLKVGQKLIIPGKAMTGGASSTTAGKTLAPAPGKTDAMAAAPAPKGPAEPVKHVVKAGETLGAIARKYQVKQGDIATANNISDPKRLLPGTELIIPGWQAPAGKSGKSAAKTTAKSAAEPAKSAPIPTISVGTEDQPTTTSVAPAGDAPPIIPVEDAPPPPKKP